MAADSPQANNLTIGILALIAEHEREAISDRVALARKEQLGLFNTTFSSLIMRFSRRSQSFSWARLKSSFDIMSVFRCEVIRLFSADIPTPRSSATCFRVSPPVSAIRTTTWRNSSVRFSPVVSLLCYSKCYQRSGIKPRQVDYNHQRYHGSLNNIIPSDVYFRRYKEILRQRKRIKQNALKARRLQSRIMKAIRSA